MDVIGHQAIGPALDRFLLAGLGQQPGIAGIIIVAEEDLLPAIAALGDVVRRARIDDASGARHAGLHRLRFTLYKCKIEESQS